MSQLAKIITASDPALRNRSLSAFCSQASLETLISECDALEAFRGTSDNLYERVRALFFLYGIHRFHLPWKPGVKTRSLVPFTGYTHLLRRRFEEAIEVFLESQRKDGPGDAISSALAEAYHSLGFQTLSDQVRRSVRSVRGNQWMFRTGHPSDYPLRIRKELLEPDSKTGLFPIIREVTPVRMDLSHSGWSDIFFLGMDYPEGARVLNISVDLCVRGNGHTPKPPVEAYFRVIDRPVLRLASVDLGSVAEISSLGEVFDFAKDYLGLLKAAIIAAGIVPPGIEGAPQPLADLLAVMTGRSGLGIEVVSRVNDIPKGSRLAVSTNLLASLITACMRATGQTRGLTGQLDEDERRLVAARAILGEWLGGSGGGWQDSGGVWPGMKLIEGVEASENDPEFGVSRGCLLPRHRLLDQESVSAETRRQIEESLVLVHGGMAQDVGPILEMVTEKYLLRSEAEWRGRQEAIGIFDDIVSTLHEGNVAALGKLTHRNFHGPIQTIIPWASNFYTESLIRQVQEEFGSAFHGFWMLGGMSGGGMGFLFDPSAKRSAQQRLKQIMSEAKRRLEGAVPFAMEPVVYDFAINEQGTTATLLRAEEALMPPGYYPMTVPGMLRRETRMLRPSERAELERFGAACRTAPELSGMVQTMFDRLLPQSQKDGDGYRADLDRLLSEYGFDPVQHEQIRSDLRSGRIGLAQNRLPVSSRIEDVRPDDVLDTTGSGTGSWHATGLAALRAGAAAVVSLAGGAGSRWTRGAGVVKALNPFCKMAGKHRNFIEIHLAKSRRVARESEAAIPHIITTSYLTHTPIEEYLRAEDNYRYPGPLYLSPGKSVGLRLTPMARDLRFAWEEMPQQLLDEQAQKVQDSLRAALIEWARTAGEGSDYTDNIPLQCLHPVGHWYETPNLFLNGVLRRLLDEFPNLRYLMMHNIDTLGVDLDPGSLGLHIESGAALTTEVITRRIEDRGGGLARVDGKLRLIEGLALPRESVEFDLSYYNTATTWIDVAQLLELLELTREDLDHNEKVVAAVRRLAARMPTYITLKDVKKRWGKGQEDIFPVCQFEKLWGDMTSLPEVNCQFVVVPRQRGQQLKEVSQLDGWLRDGSAGYVERLCDWA